MIGKIISHYKILEHLGGGGMGVVYRAEDVRLGRAVALKFLPEELSKDSMAMERFQREARCASALNHPNICTIYDIGRGVLHQQNEMQDSKDAEEVDFIVMEFLDGIPLNRILENGSLELDRLLDFAVQIVDALYAAHSEGVVHRDMKPANIFITKRGQAKVMDFGLAKLAIHGNAVSELKTQGPNPLTTPGVALGTVDYMSPEQARARELDLRTDLFSFGIVLYEMATGKRPFLGNSTVDIFDAILHVDPVPPMRLNPLLPPDLERIILKALEKDPDLRYQSAAEFRADLKRLKRDTGHQSGMHAAATPNPAISGEQATRQQSVTAITAPQVKKRSVWPLWLGIGILASIVGYFLFKRTPSTDRAELPPQFTFTRVTDQGGQEADASISPDGHYLIYRSGSTGNYDIYLQRIGGRNPINLTKDSNVDDMQPAYSPDGQFIAFRSSRDGGGIFVMGATGESVRKLTDFGYHPSWSPDGKQIVFATEGPANPVTRLSISKLWTVDLSTEQKKLLFKGDAVQPAWSPNNLRIAFWALEDGGGQRDIYTISATGGTAVAVTNDANVDWSPIWSPDGKYLYFVSDRGGSMNVWRVAIDEHSGKTLSELQPVITPARWSGDLAINKDGKSILFTSAENQANIETMTFDPVAGNTTGSSIPLTKGTTEYLDVEPSPDGNWIVFRSLGPQEDLFVARKDGTDLRQLTNDKDKDRGPTWSPDGSKIAFYSARNGTYEFWTLKPDGSGLQRATSSEGILFPVWSPDGKKLAGADVRCLIFDLTKPWPVTGEEIPLYEDRIFNPRSWSPDGKWLIGADTRPDGAMEDLLLYSLETGKFQKLADTAGGLTYRPASWLNDSTRIIFQDGNQVFLTDRITKQSHPINVNAGASEITSVRITKENKTLYFIRGQYESDIWLMQMK